MIDLVNKRLIKVGQTNSQNREEKLFGISVYEELLFLLMEFIAINIKNRVIGSSQLIYGLVQHNEIFSQFRDHPSLGQIVNPLLEV